MWWRLNLKSRYFLLDILLKEIFYIFIDMLWKGMSHWNSPDLLESLYSLEISQKLTTIKTGKNAVKSGCFEKSLRWRTSVFFEMK